MLMKDLIPSVVHICYDDELDIELDSRPIKEKRKEQQAKYQRSSKRQLYEQKRAKLRSKQRRGKNLLKLIAKSL